MMVDNSGPGVGSHNGRDRLTPRVIMITLLHNFLDSRLSISAGPRCRAFFRRFFRLNLFNTSRYLLIIPAVNTNHPPFFKNGFRDFLNFLIGSIGSDSCSWKANLGGVGQKNWRGVIRITSIHTREISIYIAIYNCC